MNLTEFLLTEYSSLAPPTKDIAFSGCRIKNFERYHVAKDSQCQPALLIEIAGSDSDDRLYPIVLEHLTAQHNVKCRISSRGKSLDLSGITVIQCVNTDAALAELFIRIIGEAIQVVGEDPKAKDIVVLLESIIKLFRSIKKPSRKSIQGLWAELFTISRSNDIETLLSAWHEDPHSHFDFSMGNERIEVKSSGMRERRHSFALEQLRPPGNCRAWLVSVFVERIVGGITLSDIMGDITGRLSVNPALLLKLELNVLDYLGEDWKSTVSDGFDLQLANESFLVFEITDIPCIETPLPPEISNVRFISDFSNIEALTLDKNNIDSPLLSCLVNN
jgi:hypothetical protein